MPMLNPTSSQKGMLTSFFWHMLPAHLVVFSPTAPGSVPSSTTVRMQWHAKHGLVLMAAELVLLLGLSIVMQLLMVITFGIGCLASIGFVFIWAGVLALHVFAAVRALQGHRLTIPGVSHYASRF